MKKISLLIIIMMVSTFFIGCDSDPCDDGYTQLDSGVCVPDYIVGIEKKTELGTIFYHSEYGVIMYSSGNWYNDENIIIKNIND